MLDLWIELHIGVLLRKKTVNIEFNKSLALGIHWGAYNIFSMDKGELL